MMEHLLYLTHRIPFPPTKGDKVRSYHVLKFLASRYRVHLGTFVDDPSDVVHVPKLGEFCASFKAVQIKPAIASVRSLSAFLTGEPLTLRYYRDRALEAWVHNVVRNHAIRNVVVCSSAMAQYVATLGNVRVVVDFVDVDSAKWNEFGRVRRWPLSAIFAREGQRLLEFERAVARRAEASVFVTEGEAELFRKLAPESASRVCHVVMGVDTEFFSPRADLPSPYAASEEVIVFTGTMSYWPNVDAVCWFAQESLPAILAKRPGAKFYIVGMHPAAAVQALTRNPGIVVTGRVEDVRPYLQHARVVVAPLRIARGVQSKVLEAMAMARPVVVSSSAARALSAKPGVDFEVAEGPEEFARKTLALMEDGQFRAIGKSARQRVMVDHHWTTSLAPFDELLKAPSAA